MPHVTFSNDVSKSDGHAITIEERRPGDLHSNTSGNPFVGQTINICPNSSDHNIKNSVECTNGNESTLLDSDKVEILAVKMGILKCGYRYRVSVPIASKNCNVIDEVNELQLNPQPQNDFRIIKIDGDDINAEIEDGAHVNVLLSAIQRGTYIGRLFIETFQKNNTTSNDTTQNDLNNSTEKLQSIIKNIVSIQIEASIMGKGMGTPQLRNGVSCMGKLAGYDSDEDTEWQGFN